MNKDLDSELKIGAKIRQYRTASKMSMKELAESSDISQSMLSQIERDTANPSINTLRLIASTLGIPVFQLFIDENNINKFVVTPETRKKLTFSENNNLSYELLTPDLNGDIQFCRMVLPPDSLTLKESMNHVGEEVALVLKGRVNIFFNESKVTLEKDHSIRIPAGTKHRWENSFHEEVEVIFAITPPSF